MKRILLLTSIICLASIIYAQEKKVYLTANFSKDFSAGKQVLGTRVTSSTREIISGSNGKGVSAGPGIGYMFNNNIGLELNFLFFSGSEYDFNVGNNTDVVNSSMKRIITAVKFTTGNKFKPFAKFGFVVGISPKLDREAITTYQTYRINEYASLRGGTPTGWTGSLGFDWHLSNVTGLFLEGRLINQTWAPTEMTYKVSGGGLYQTEFYNLVDQMPLNSPGTFLKYYHNFSSMGLNIGLKFTLGNKKPAASN